MGGNRNKRQEEKQEREQAKKASESKQKAKEEEKQWVDTDKGALKKAQKEAEAEAKRMEAQRKKEEKARLLAEEQEELARSKKGKGDHTPKLTREMIQRNAERQAAERTRALQEERSNPVPVSLANPNHQTDFDVAASSVDAALAALAVDSGASGERHPERRHKALWNAYLERRLQELKMEHKGLRLTQYREIAWKEWQKSPENPFNQESIAYNEPNPNKAVVGEAEGPLPTLKQSELEAMTKRDLAELLQQHSDADFAREHNLSGAAKNVVKKKTQDELIAIYRELAKKQ